MGIFKRSEEFRQAKAELDAYASKKVKEETPEFTRLNARVNKAIANERRK